jgi:hypothetical protein
VGFSIGDDVVDLSVCLLLEKGRNCALDEVGRASARGAQKQLQLRHLAAEHHEEGAAADDDHHYSVGPVDVAQRGAEQYFDQRGMQPMLL